MTDGVFDKQKGKNLVAYVDDIVVVTPSVLHCKSFKTCHEHHVYVLMHVIKSVDQLP